MIKIVNIIFVILIMLLSGCNEDNTHRENNITPNLAEYHALYNKLDTTAKKTLPSEHFITYEKAIMYSMDGNNLKALNKLESLLLNPLFHQDARLFQIVDVRYQSIIRITRLFERPSKVYKEILNNFSYLYYVEAANNFNQAIMLKINTEKNIEMLFNKSLYKDNISKEHKDVYRKFFNSVFIDGSKQHKNNAQKTVSDLHTNFDALLEKYSGSSRKMEIKNLELNLSKELESFINAPDSVNSIFNLISKINSTKDILYIKQYIGNYKYLNINTRFLFEYLDILNKSIDNFYDLLNKTKLLASYNSNNQYIITTVAFLEFLAPFKNVQNSKDTLDKFSKSLSNYDERKSSVNHHLGMLSSWSNGRLITREGRSTCKCDLGFWSIEYECF